MFNTNLLGAIYVSSIPLITPPQQPPQVDDQGQPIKIRKKPGRKPNPASPALRKAQNRAAQRAFRERKERHLKDLEGTIKQLRDQRNHALKELNQTKAKMDAFRAENWYLKGVVLTLQFVCLHHNIHIPTHSPYLTEEALSEMAKTTPHAIEAYVNAYTRNNIHLKPTMAAHFSNTDIQDDDDEQQQQEEEEDEEEREGYDRREEDMEQDTPHQRHPSLTSSETDHSVKEEQIDPTPTEEEGPNPSSISAIQRLRLQLRLQSTLSNIGKSAARLQPTILQLAIPHDPRIDLIPTPHMRDRMIIFRDLMDYDRCFALLLNGALYHGGDPTMSASWELPPEFFTEFWYLAINYDVTRTNTWRRLKGLPDITAKETIEQHQRWNPDPQESVWTDDVFSQMTAGMPTLQPLDSNHLASGFDFGSPNLDILDQSYLLHSEERHRSPSIGAMMNLMNSLSTDPSLS
ncbi:uncharacterized protein B0P05DRAFT_480162 [Gilbertella persicaria]|uniref:uncharacterized protein n=1 Tax=Gilbertella persicaria TaxID=101096 RepID=UPI0022212244|nr:uncharacterized protein B0P05DRAFT_480162 [Gilbertella persicaria]KAI8051078.1 hypothetical protein B0P05DRAFT_480162 [Gilbertella persicaria]